VNSVYVLWCSYYYLCVVGDGDDSGPKGDRVGGDCGGHCSGDDRCDDCVCGVDMIMMVVI
jgi:hypothetical protein